MKQKRIFITIFVLFAFLMTALPFLVSFNDVLTKLVEKFTLYNYLQSKIVPVEIKTVSILVSLVGIKAQAAINGFWIKGSFLEMTWNCLGWQSLLLLAITLLVGLYGTNYTRMSKFEALIISILGTFLINVLRLSFIVVLFDISRPIYAVVYHDYLAAIVTIIWLFIFWWFAYSYILEEKGSSVEKLAGSALEENKASS